MKRSGYLKRTRLKRKTTLKKVNRDRKKRQRARGIKGPYHTWIMGKPCTFRNRGNHRCYGRVDSHHLIRTGKGGVDYANCIPLCRGGHQEIHSLTAEDIRKKYGMTRLGMELEAGALAREWNKDHG